MGKVWQNSRVRRNKRLGMDRQEQDSRQNMKVTTIRNHGDWTYKQADGKHSDPGSRVVFTRSKDGAARSLCTRVYLRESGTVFLSPPRLPRDEGDELVKVGLSAKSRAKSLLFSEVFCDSVKDASSNFDANQ